MYISSPPDLDKIKAYGKWLDASDHKVNVLANFNVDTRNCGDGELEVHILHTNSNTIVPVKVLNNDGLYNVELLPIFDGIYSTNLLFGGLQVPSSYGTNVVPTCDLTKTIITGINTSK